MIQALTDLIIRPPRSSYNPIVDLGPQSFYIDNKHVGVRVDFKVTNRRNQVLECSFFHRKVYGSKKYPTMVYCHGNTGNRTNSYGTVYSMLRSKVNVLTFDFAGCGASEGKTISLGYFEQDDIEDVLDYAIKTFEFIDTHRIGIWGRCMGAVSAILYTARTNTISLLILDTPFPDFVSLIRHYVERVKIIPKWAEDYMYNNIRAKVKEQANFDFEEIRAIDKISKCRVPAYFIHGVNDGIIPSHLFKKVYEAYPAAKEYLELQTSHNDSRPESTYEKISAFVKAKFFPPCVYGRFEPTPKQSNSKAKQVITAGFTLLSLDTIKFNQNAGDSNEDGINAMRNMLESIGREKSDDIKSFPDLDEHLIDKLSQKPTTSYVKNSFLQGPKESQEKPNNGKLMKIPPTLHKAKTEPAHMLEKKLQNNKTILEEEEGDISEELLDSGEIANRDYLEVSFIETAAKLTFDSFRKKKRRSLSNISNPNH